MPPIPDGPQAPTSLRETLLLRERALSATSLSVTLADVRLPDMPLVWVNAAFTRTTGYSASEVVGRNCRFLQGPGTDPEMVEQMRAAIRQHRETTVTVLNYRADGSKFWNQVSLGPVLDDEGELVGYLGLQVDCSEQLGSTEPPRVPEAQRRLGLLATVAREVADSPDLASALDRLEDVLRRSHSG